MTELYLVHHGIKGQKWGVRRYQNYDGSYTQAGMKRYNQSLEKYNDANDRYIEAKKSKKSKTEITNARLERKKAKSRLEKDYKHLKQDKLGDKGKELYSRGKTITGNSAVTQTLATIGGLSIAAAKYDRSTLHYGSKTVDDILTVSGSALIGISGIKEVYDRNEARKLRAYYSHTSKY